MKSSSTDISADTIAEAKVLLRAKALRDLQFYLPRMHAREQDPTQRLQGGATDERQDRATLRDLIQDLQLANEGR